MRPVALLALLVAAAACREPAPSPPVADPASQRSTRSGAVVGTVGDYGDHVWRAIPYAAAPVGPLRWRAPQPPPAWDGTREALAFGSPCVQYANTLGGVAGRPGEMGGDENCLFLNVYAPRLAPGALPTGAARLPVMVWIHGGGNTIGEAGFYNGGHLATAEQVVVVTINYRLGPFGWFRHAALRAGATPAEQSGNFATLDQIAALAWVRDNIAAFGGDPDNVTIFGESAGGRNVFALLSSPAAAGLFHRAIAQSGGLRSSDLLEAEQPADGAPAGHARSSGEVVLQLLQADGRAADRAAAQARAASMTAADLAGYLRAAPATAILGVYEPGAGFGMIDLPQVFPDGVVIPAGDPLERFADGTYNRVPVMLGTTRDEDKLFMFADPAHVRRILWIVPRIRDPRMYNLTAEYLAKMWKATGADEPAAALHASQEHVYVYRFDWDEQPTLMGADLSELVGAAHSFEIPFVFGHFDLGPEGNVMFTTENEPGRRELSERMMAYWAEFARRGAPGRGTDGTLPEWQAWDGEPGRFLILDTDAGGGLRMSTDTVSSAELLAALDADPRLTDASDRCAVLQQLAKRTKGYDATRYAARADCKAFPLDEAAG